MTAKSSGRVRAVLLISGLTVAVAAGGLAAVAAEAQKGGTLIWASSGTLVGGKALGERTYGVAVDETGVYAIGDQAHGAIIEKLGLTDGKPLWKQPQGIKGSAEGMDLTIDKDFLYTVAVPWTLEKRKLSDGSVIWHVIGSKGKPYTVVVDSTGAYMGGHGWAIEKRSLENGSVIWEQKGPSGVVLSSAVNGEGIYFGGYDTETGPKDPQWRIEKRSLKDGSLIWFHNVNSGPGDEKVYGMAVDATGVYAAGEDNTPGTGGQWRIEKRSLKDGKLIWQQFSNPTPGWDKAHGMAGDSTGLYIQGYQNGGIWRMEKHSLTDGKLIWEATEGAGRMWYGIDVSKDAVYFSGYVGGGHGGQWRIEKRAK